MRRRRRRATTGDGDVPPAVAERQPGWRSGRVDVLRAVGTRVPASACLRALPESLVPHLLYCKLSVVGVGRGLQKTDGHRPSIVVARGRADLA